MQFLRGPVVKMLEALGYATASKFNKRRMARRLPEVLELAKNEDMELDDMELNKLLQKMIASEEVEVVTEYSEPQVTNFESAEGEVVDVEVAEAKEEQGDPLDEVFDEVGVESEEMAEARLEGVIDEDDPSDGALEEIEDDEDEEEELKRQLKKAKAVKKEKKAKVVKPKKEKKDKVVKPKKKKKASAYGSAVDLLCVDPDMSFDQLKVKIEALGLFKESAVRTALSGVRSIVRKLRANGLMG